MTYKKINIIIIVIALILLPDMILSYSGRDTFFVHRMDLLIDIGRLFILFAIILFFVELAASAVKKKWKNTSAYLLLALSLFISVDFSISYLSKKSSTEALSIINSFVNRKDSKNFIDVVIEDEVKQLYDNYMSNPDLTRIKLEWFSSGNRRYEFKVSPENSQQFIITLNTSQSKPPEIWVHK